jgi:hypothetical protein
MWQEFIVGACVLAALLFVLRAYLPVGKKDKKSLRRLFRM